jgi:hypothetical protein
MYVRSSYRSNLIPFISVTGIEPIHFIASAVVLNRGAFEVVRHLYESRFITGKEKATIYNEFQRERRSEYYKDKRADIVSAERIRKQSAASFQRSKKRIYQYRNNRRKSDPSYRISCNLRTYIFQRVGKKNNTGQSRFREVVGCTIDEFRKYLESHWEAWMNWSNYGRGEGKWNIDHTRPCASFDLTDNEQVKQCFHFSNMRPMCAVKNLLKSDTFPSSLKSHTPLTSIAT